MNLTDVKPLQPLTYGNILIVGGKPSNFDDELRTHPRVIMWDSQHEHWTDKELPQNVRAVFITRFIGHVDFAKILKEARKKQITIFNPEGTGMIVKQVRELLDISRNRTIMEPIQTMTTPTPVNKGQSKLHALMPFVDPSKSISDNARFLIIKAKEMNIETTVGSIAQKISVERRKASGAPAKTRGRYKASAPSPEVPRRVHKHVDVSVEILDNMVKELQDMRDYLVAVTEENKSLKLRIEKFKKALDND